MLLFLHRAEQIPGKLGPRLEINVDTDPGGDVQMAGSWSGSRDRS